MLSLKVIQNLSYFKVFLLLTVLYLGFQMKPWTNVVGSIYSGDDNNYYGYVSSLVNDFDVDFSNNEVQSDAQKISPVTGRIIVGHPIGTSLLLMPFYIMVKPFVLLAGRITHTPFDQRHVFFFMSMCLGILLYAYLGGYLLYRTGIHLGADRYVSLLSVTAIIWGTILPAYIFKRPIFTHVPAFFLISAGLYLIVKWRDKQKGRFDHVLVLGLISGGIVITRWDDVFVAVCIGYVLCMRSVDSLQKGKACILKTALFFLTVFCVFFLTQGLAWKAFSGSYFTAPYDPLTVTETLATPLSPLSVILHSFIGLDWGIVYTMLPFVAGLICFMWFNPLAVSGRCVLDRIVYGMVFFIPFMVILTYRQHGSYYGYRYLLSLLPFACLGLTTGIEAVRKKSSRAVPIIAACICVLIMFNFFLMLPFEYSEATTLTPGYNKLGGAGWINDRYVFNAIKIYFVSPVKTFLGLFMRGFAGGYAFVGAYVFFPDIFLNAAEASPKISSYYAINSYDRWIALFYPFLALIGLALLRVLLRKINQSP